ncbi:aquaporin, partial [Candidatus Saccharibacteria bacterium]|nr:aquaporin [Candidatus Saccharibacteria bacterium]
DEDEDEDEDDEEDDDDDLDDESEEESEEDDEEEEDEDKDDEEEEEPKVVTKKKSSKKASKKAKAEFKNNVKKNKSAKVTTKIISSKAKPSAVKTFFARKGDENENILTIFKDTRIIGAIVGEIFGTAIITMIALTLGLFNPLYMILAYVGITLAIVKLSGAHLNPIVTAGMMASRRVSAVRGVIYIISQVLGSWLGFLVINGFYQAGINSGNIEAATSVLPTLTATGDLVAANADYSFFWAVTMVEFIGAIIIAFFFARAQRVKENKVAFAITVSAGVFVAMLLAVVINSNFFGQQSNTFVLNPAVGMMYGIFPASAEGVDSLMNALMPMLVTYVIFPIFGGVLGFYLSDFANLMEGKDLKDNVEE